MNKLTTIAEQVRIETNEKRREYQEEVARQIHLIERSTEEFWQINALRKAAPQDYIAWLTGFIEKGGKPTHYYDYKMPAFYVAQSNVTTFPLCGFASVNVIVPAHLAVDQNNGIGHCNFYLMKDFNCIGGWIPIYTDTK